MGRKDASEEIAEVARVFSDATRVRIVSLLMEDRRGGGLTTMDIATRLGVPQPRVSSHLAILLKYSLLSVSSQGRQRIYTIDSRRVAPILNAFAGSRSTAKGTAFTRREKERAGSAIRRCRTCYDHLAGEAGVALLDGILRAGWLDESRQERRRKPMTVYRLSESGLKPLLDLGVDVHGALRSSRVFAYGCMDWTERRPHLGGSLGKAVLVSVLSRGIAERIRGTRALNLLRPVSTWFDA